MKKRTIVHWRIHYSAKSNGYWCTKADTSLPEPALHIQWAQTRYQPCTDSWPRWYTKHLTSYPWDVQQEESHGHKGGNPYYPAIHLFKRNCHHTVQTVLHKMIHPYASHVKSRLGNETAIACHVIIQEMHERSGIYCIAAGTSKIHMDDVKDAQSHEKVFQVMQHFIK